MRKILTTALAVALTWVAASAVPAKPGVTRTVTQPDGTTLTVRLVGDEYHHALLTDDGLMVAENENGVMCYRTADGVSDVMAHPKALRTAAEMAFLAVNQQKTDWRTNAGQAAKRARAKRAPKKVGECPHSGSVKVPVLLVQFSDVSFANSYDTVKAAYTSTTGKSAYRYYYENSDGKFIPQFDVYGPVTLSYNRAYYGANDSDDNDLRPAEMVNEACSKLNSSVDFSQYDNDGDGVCDVVIVVYAGGGEAQTGVAEQIWPHQWQLSSAGISASSRKYDNTYIDAYAVFNELNGDSTSQLDGDSTTKLDGIGTFCHEFGHCLGLPDFYDIKYGNHFGMGDWSLMCGGNYNDDGYTPAGLTGHERDFLGWRSLETPTPGTNITLQAMQNGGKAYKVVNDKHPNEYYVLENRQMTNWDEYLPSKGLMVTHVDYNQTFWESNYVNCTSTGSTNNHQRMTIIPADNSLSMTYYQGSYYTVESDEVGDLFPYGGNNELTDSSTPAAKVYNNSSADSNASSANYYMGKPITEITQNSDGTVSLWYMRGETTPLDAPELADASAITTSGWTANWSAVTGAATYELQIDPASGGGSSTTGTVYTKVTDATTLSAGDKIIMVDETANKAAGSISSKVLQSVDVTISSSSIDLDGVTDVNVFTLEGNSSAWKLKQSDGTYLVSTTAKSMSSNSTGTSVTISISSGNATIDFGNAGKILYNNDSPRFTTYTSNPSKTMRLPQIYKLGGSSSAPRRAGVTTKTITDITDTSYAVTGMADDQNYTFKVRAVPATTDAEHSTGDWSNVKTVKTKVGTHEPSIAANETMNFGSIYVDATKTADLEIIYDGLTAPISATITGTGKDMFSCAPSIEVASAGYNEATLKVTYSPTAAGTHTATLTLSSTGAEVTCTLTGTATLATYNPVMQDATGVTTSAFTATWTDQTDAEAVESYTLQISKKPETTTTTVNDELTYSSIDVTGTSYSDWSNKSGTSGAKYAGNSAGGYSAIQLRSTSPAGIVSTTSGGKIKKVTVVWNSHTSGRTLDVYGSNTPYDTGADLYSSSTQGTKLGSISSDNATELTISGDYAYIGVRSNSGAMYLDKITFTWEKTTTTGGVQRRRAVSDTGNADSDVRTITGITSKSYEVTGLTAGVTYEYKVKAIYTDRAEADESAWSNVMEVTLDDGPHTPTLAAGDLEFDGDNYVNGTYKKTLTVLGEYLSGDVTVSIAGDDAEMFSVASQTIAASAFTGGEYALTVTYSPTAAGTHSATLTLSSDGAEDVTVNLTGIADWQLFDPVMLTAQSVTSSSFKAVWTDDTNASKVKSYTLYVNKKPSEPIGYVYQLLTNASDLAVDDELIIVNSASAGTAKAVSTSIQSDYYIAPASVSISSNLQIELPAEEVAILKLGGSVGQWTLSATNKNNQYLSNKTDYSNLVYASSVSDNTKVSISIANQIATIQFITGSKGKVISWDSTHSDFTTTTGESNVYIYKKTPVYASSAPRRVVAESGDADNGGLTVTGITDKFYTVENLTAGATYEFKVKTVYSDDTESEWSNVEEVTLEESSDPRLVVEPLALAFTNVTTGATEQQTFTVTGTNLTGDVTVAVGEGMFTVSPTTISAADAAEGATITVTYAPTAFGNHTATVTLTSAGAEAVSVELSGSAVLEKAAPVMAEAVNATTTSFKAVWTDATPAANVRDYTLYVNKIADPVTPGDDEYVKVTSSSDMTSGTYLIVSEEEGVAFNGGLSTLDANNNYISVTIVDNKIASNATVDAASFTYDASANTLKSASGYYIGETSDTNGLKSSTSTAYTNTVSIESGNANIVSSGGAHLRFNSASNAMRFRYYKSSTYTAQKAIQLYKLVSGSAGAPRRVVATDGDADNGGLTVTGITDKEYTVTGLTPGATYEFYVEANYVDDTKSESNHKEVTLPAGTSLAEVLKSERGSYTISDNLIIVAVLNNMAYATNGTDWLPINVESGDNFVEGDKITLLNGSFNGSTTAPLFTLTECGESTAEITYSIADFYLGQDWTGEGNASAVWERMPAAGEVVNFYGYYFLENGVPTLRGYSGTTGTKEKGRRLILLGDNYGTLDLDEGSLYKVEVCVQLAEPWSVAPRRIASGDADAYQNLRGQVINVKDITTGIDDIIAAGDVQSVRYINAAGQMSSEPFAGLNIVVTTLTDGTVRVAKVLK